MEEESYICKATVIIATTALIYCISNLAFALFYFFIILVLLFDKNEWADIEKENKPRNVDERKKDK